MKVYELEEALKRICENPNNHGYSEQEYKEIITLQHTMQEDLEKMKLNFNQFSSHLAKIFEDLIEKMNEVNKHLPSDLEALSKYGWYVSESNSLQEIFMIAKEAKNENRTIIDDLMLKFYKKESKRIIFQLCKQYPNRKDIIQEAYNAHRKRMYFASTILFLSQADGVCSGELFRTKDNKKRLKDLIKENETPEPLSILLNVLTKISAIDVYYKQESESQIDLNRHGVMHGYSVNYGTEINSYKALSLLSFVASFFERHKRV
jgi:hypothetical protein